MEHSRNLRILTPLLDVDGALRRLGGDVELFEQINQIFLEDAPGLVHSAREALANSDAGELRRSAHSIKGMMAQLGAATGVAAAYRLEQCAAAGDLSDASGLIRECGDRVAEVTQRLDEYNASGEAPGELQAGGQKSSAAT
jgi:HPt (histidine-containing phosphotransfer) domain-containing protein